MTITPLRLLLLCIIAFSIFYGFETAEPIQNSKSNYRLDDGSLVVSVQSPSFPVDPFMGIKGRTISTKRRMTLAQANLTDDCPPSRPDLPIEAALVGEVARTAINYIETKPRLAFVEKLMLQPEKPQNTKPLVIAKLPRVEPVKTIKPAVMNHQKSAKTKKASINSTIKLAQRKPHEAIRLFTTIIEDPDEPTVRRAAAHYWRGKTHKRMNEPLSCLSDIRKAIAMAPNNSTYLNGLAWLLVTIRPQKLRNAKEAIELAKKAVDLSEGKRANYLDTLAKTQFAMGKAEDAVETQSRAVSLAPDNKSFTRRLRRYEMAVTAD